MFQRIEIQYHGDYFVGNGGSRSNKEREAVESCINENRIAVLVSFTGPIKEADGISYLTVSWKTSKSLSRRPEASASKLGNGRRG